jgi:signal transduction histidine kinase
MRGSSLVERSVAAIMSRFGMVALAILLGAAVIGLLVLSYRSVGEWRGTSRNLAENRAELMLTLLSTAISRDMKGAHTSVLLPLELADVLEEPPFALRETFARALARFPYAESFFVWRNNGGSGTFYAFHREDRLPTWDPIRGRLETYPTVVRVNPKGGQLFVSLIQEQAVRRRRFVLFDCSLGGTSYQVVVKFLAGHDGDQPAAVVGFMVNLKWVREHYYLQLAEEISRMGDPAGTIPLVIADAEGTSVAKLRSMDSARAVRQSEFFPFFVEPVMLASLALDRPMPRPWTVRVASVDDEVQMAATRGAYAMLIVAASVSLFGLLLTMRTVRAREQLIAMQTEFVSTVTHELKTPLAVIRLLGETLGTGRYDSLDTVRDYAQLLSQEACRLTRLIENLLMYSRLTEQQRSEPLEVIEVGELVEDTLTHYRPLLSRLEFDLAVDVPVDLPRLRGDRSSLMQALDNLIDNAIKYSDGRRSLSIRSELMRDGVRIEVADRGVGIPAADVPRVFDKFYRGRAVRTGGSGLGLAIVKRVMQEHNGHVEISSVVGEGTTLSLVLPLDVANG